PECHYPTYHRRGTLIALQHKMYGESRFTNTSPTRREWISPENSTRIRRELVVSHECKAVTSARLSRLTLKHRDPTTDVHEYHFPHGVNHATLEASKGLRRRGRHQKHIPRNLPV